MGQLPFELSSVCRQLAVGVGAGGGRHIVTTKSTFIAVNVENIIPYREFFRRV